MWWRWTALLGSGLAMVDGAPERLTVAHTWDGVALDATAATVTLVADRDALRIELEARFHGDPPPPGPPGPTARLWTFEVVEVFLAGPAGDDGRVPYTEIELGPHGHHLVLRLDGVRRVVEQGLALDFEAAIDGDRWRGVTRVPWAYLPAGPWSGNAYAIHGAGDQRRYLASVPVPGAKPDFHQPSRFRPIALERPATDGDVR